MAIFVCSKCNHIQEVSNEHIGKRAKCPQCSQEDIIYNTANYIKELADKKA
jgi:DNA-directed RNA polymerase subunit RPC12/RpoP